MIYLSLYSTCNQRLYDGPTVLSNCHFDNYPRSTTVSFICLFYLAKLEFAKLISFYPSTPREV
jgi:hypothetical protein